ncbi:MAG: FKBP-type peptidyl-prolyl cis-trans isomerase [Bacteroidota bacterium]|jgi:FKBP-type peptidyl-prolyl cis-trans isomerase FkpA
MKQTTFTLLLFAVIALVSCRKDKYDPTINQYDDDQIKAYITANGITGMTRDTSGIYYKIINPGKKDSIINYSSHISMVFGVSSLDGKYLSTDTIANHYDGFAGHLVGTTYPLGLNASGLQTAIHDILKLKGGIMRVIIPSHLAYGVDGAGSGSSSVTSGRIGGNQSLDYYIHIIDDQWAYDQASIKKYVTQNNLTSVMLPDPAGFWYQIRQPGTGNVPITTNTTFDATYTIRLLNSTIIDQYNNAGGVSFEIPNIIKGAQLGLQKYATAGSLLTLVIPSHLAYGDIASSIMPANSVVTYEVQVISVAP